MQLSIDSLGVVTMVTMVTGDAAINTYLMISSVPLQGIEHHKERDPSVTEDLHCIFLVNILLHHH